jgi:STE24 endopeptidase
MNLYGVIILLTLISEFILQLIADFLNLQSLSTKVPKEFEGVYDADKYAKSQEYTRVRTRFGIISSAFSLIVTLIFWFAGGFNSLDTFVRNQGLAETWNGLLYIGMLVLARSILSLPFSIYSTFVIEERFGFNKTTVTTYIADLFKGMALGVVLGAPLLILIFWLFDVGGVYAWLYCWGATSLFTLIIQFIAPTWIMPIFNKFTPLEEGELRKEILSFADRVQFPLQGVYVMDGSKRSSKSNAFFTGFGKFKRIALFDTLIKQHTLPELIAVLAHEIGHYKKKHIVTGMVISIAHMGVMFFLLSVFLWHRELFDAFFMEKMSVYAGLIFFGMLFAPAEFFLSLGMNMLSRKHEFEADRFSSETTTRPAEMISALKKLSVDNLSNLTPHPFYVFLHYSHPPVLERIRAISGSRSHD